MAIKADESLALTLRVLTSAELFLHASYYSSHPHFTTLLSTQKAPNSLESFFQVANAFEVTDLLESNSNSYFDCVKFEALRNCQDKRWSPFISLMALSSVLGLEIHSFCLDAGVASSVTHLLYNSNIKPRQCIHDSSVAPIRVF